MPPAPMLRRLHTKTSVPLHACPPTENPALDLTSEVVEHSEEFLSKHFFRKLDGQQQYNWVYERLRAFYTKQVHPRTLGKECLLKFQQLPDLERQKEGRRAFKELQQSERVEVARAWKTASAPPPSSAQSSKRASSLRHRATSGR